MKTKSSSKKRFKVTASGKVYFKKGNLRHILTKKTAKRRRHLRKHALLTTADRGRILETMPYA